MTALTTISITLALFLGAAIVIALRQSHIADSMTRANKARNVLLSSYKESENDTNPVYGVSRINKPGHELFGCWAVYRSTLNGYRTVIKVFTDEDDDFNKREAEELCEILNSK